MNYRAKLSPWDSDLFNYQVGLLDLSFLPKISRIKEDNRKSFDVVFVKIPGWVDVSGVEALDYRYDMELSDSKKEARKHPVKSIECVLAKHFEIASTAFADSRFNFDRHLKSRAYEVYPRWLAAEKLLYTFSRRDGDAFIAVKDDGDDARRISLIAVSEKLRSSGLGQVLVRGMFDLEKKRTWRVRVSARNHRAIRFYETLGFRMRDVSTAFHVWSHENE